ncbi:hypothetical protein DFS34DRAFT_589814 [Phlyctochytrium arcticum]|nr:hypothetical protein DFS34DRAFT_589814 [Phlyctochytrium arcticum]
MGSKNELAPGQSRGFSTPTNSVKWQTFSPPKRTTVGEAGDSTQKQNENSNQSREKFAFSEDETESSLNLHVFRHHHPFSKPPPAPQTFPKAQKSRRSHDPPPSGPKESTTSPGHLADESFDDAQDIQPSAPPVPAVHPSAGNYTPGVTNTVNPMSNGWSTRPQDRTAAQTLARHFFTYTNELDPGMTVDPNLRGRLGLDKKLDSESQGVKRNPTTPFSNASSSKQSSTIALSKPVPNSLYILESQMNAVEKENFDPARTLLELKERHPQTLTRIQNRVANQALHVPLHHRTYNHLTPINTHWVHLHSEARVAEGADLAAAVEGVVGGPVRGTGPLSLYDHQQKIAQPKQQKEVQSRSSLPVPSNRTFPRSQPAFSRHNSSGRYAESESQTPLLPTPFLTVRAKPAISQDWLATRDTEFNPLGGEAFKFEDKNVKLETAVKGVEYPTLSDSPTLGKLTDEESGDRRRRAGGRHPLSSSTSSASLSRPTSAVDPFLIPSSTSLFSSLFPSRAGSNANVHRNVEDRHQPQNLEPVGDAYRPTLTISPLDMNLTSSCGLETEIITLRDFY